MGGVGVSLIIIGIMLVGVGFFTFKYPDIRWKYSLSRHWFLKGGEPTEFYYSSQRIGAVIYMLFGGALLVAGISMPITAAKGCVVEIDGNELKFPCTYSDVEALGFQIDSAEEIRTIQATGKNLKNYDTYVAKNAEGKEITLTFVNTGSVDAIATECELSAIRVEAKNGPDIKLPNGVKMGMSENDVKSIMGRGTPKGVGGSGAEYRLKENMNTYKINLVYSSGFMNRRVISVRIEDAMY